MSEYTLIDEGEDDDPKGVDAKVDEVPLTLNIGVMGQKNRCADVSQMKEKLGYCLLRCVHQKDLPRALWFLYVPLN